MPQGSRVDEGEARRNYGPASGRRSRLQPSGLCAQPRQATLGLGMGLQHFHPSGAAFALLKPDEKPIGAFGCAVGAINQFQAVQVSGAFLAARMAEIEQVGDMALEQT